MHPDRLGLAVQEVEATNDGLELGDGLNLDR
jgi:hypothetical protein